MAENQRKNIKNLNLRAKSPMVARGLGIFVVIAAILAIGIGFYLEYGRETFRMKNFPATLSKDVVAEVGGFERRESENGVPKYFLKADKATTFTDNHQELENAYVEVYDETGENFDKIKAEKAVYVPAENKNFTIYLAGDVNIETRDHLQVKTDNLTFTKADDTANAEEYVEFERGGVTGNAVGAIVKTAAKSVELLKDVNIKAFAVDPNDEFSRTDLQSAEIKAGHAVFDQIAEKIFLENNTEINLTPKAANQQPTDIKARQATAFFVKKEISQIDLKGDVEVYQKPTAKIAKWTKTRADRVTAKIDQELKKLELFDNVNIQTSDGGDSEPTDIKTNYALFLKDQDRFELKNGVEITTTSDKEKTDIKSNEAIYDQANNKIFLSGNAEVTQKNDYIKGEQINVDLHANKKLKFAVAKGNAYLKQATSERTTEIAAPELNASFNEQQQMQNANSIGASNVNMIPARADDYTKLNLAAPNAIHLNFQANGLVGEMQTEGRATIRMNAPNSRADAANKRLTADNLKTVFQADGKSMKRTEAVGNAELYIEPLQNSAQNYKTTINAPRFDCDFYETGNAAKICSGETKTKTVRVPTVAAENRGTQTLLADKLNAIFEPQTQDIKQFDAVGNTKFNENDRNGIAEQINFTAGDEIVRLRGGEPTVWDAAARAKANEIDWDTRNEKSNLRGSVSTTYYSQKKTGGATPFAQTDSPVFLTAANAEFDHAAETALYTGNARAWQDNNFVSGDRMLIQQKQGQFFADGNVKSLLYDAEKREGGKVSKQPVFAAANKMTYAQANNLLRYEGNVDIRQGTDRITSGIANVFLDKNNELKQTVAEQNVVITSPNRKASGDWAQYTAENEVVILRGSPARVEDAEQGSTQNAQLTVYMRENRFVSEGDAQQKDTGRLRSVYKIKKND